MRELHDMFNCYFSEPQRPLVLATLFSVEGSHVYRPGALLALSEAGATYGRVSAGCLEGDLCSHARSLFATGGSKMIHYGAEGLSDNVFGLGLDCGGSVRVLLERLPNNRAESHLWFLKAALEKYTECTSVTLWMQESAQLFESPQRLIVAKGECVFETISDEKTRKRLQKLVRQRANASLSFAQIQECSERVRDALLITHRAQYSLTIYGTGEITTALTGIARFLRWRVTVIESQAALEHAKCLSSSCNGVVVLAHNDTLEAQLLQALLPLELTYVGILGSRSRIGRIVARIRDSHSDWPEEFWRKLYAPIGLDIGSESPQEIAVSIVSEIMAVMNEQGGEALEKSSVNSLRCCSEPVHRRRDTLIKLLS